MRYLPLRNEKSVDDITRKLYKNLSGAEKKKVEAALLKSNPKLREFDKLGKGTLIRLPKLSADIERKSRSIFAPNQDLESAVIEGLQEISKNIESSIKQAAADDKQTTAEIKKAAFSKAMKADPKAREHADQLKKRIAADNKLNSAKLKAVDSAVKALTKVASQIQDK